MTSMSLKQILDRCDHLEIEEARSSNEEYYELVVLADEADEWARVLMTILGPARKPKGVEPTNDDLHLTKASGGIRLNQTLFERDFGDGTILANLWPWDDGVHLTLKMALLVR